MNELFLPDILLDAAAYLVPYLFAKGVLSMSVSLALVATDDGHFKATLHVPGAWLRCKRKDGTSVPASIAVYDKDAAAAQAQAIAALVRLVFDLDLPAADKDAQSELDATRLEFAKALENQKVLQSRIGLHTETIAKLEIENANIRDLWTRERNELLARAIAAEEKVGVHLREIRRLHRTHKGGKR